MIEGGLRLKGLLKNNDSNDLITIITVVYNGELCIENTIKSVIEQNYYNFEFIVIDGKSKDNTLEIIKKYEDKIDYWISESDSGISNAFNKGISLARGEIIGIINSDDYYYSKKTLDLVMNAYNHLDPNIICGSLIIKHPHRTDRVWESTLSGIDKEMTIAHPSTFVPKIFYNDYGTFNENFRIAMDYELMIRFLKADIKFKMISDVLTIMRAGGLSSIHYYTGIKEFCKAQKIHLKKRISLYTILYLRFRYLQSLGMKFLDKIGLGYFVSTFFKRNIYKHRTKNIE